MLLSLWSSCCGQSVRVPPKFIGWNLEPQCIRRWAFSEIIQFRLGHESGALMMSYCSSKTLESLFVHLTCTQRRIHVSTQPWSNHLQGKNRGLRMEPSLLAPWSWTAQPPKLWEISSYRWSHPTLGILLWLIQTFFFKCIYSGL